MYTITSTIGESWTLNAAEWSLTIPSFIADELVLFVICGEGMIEACCCSVHEHYASVSFDPTHSFQFVAAVSFSSLGHAVTIQFSLASLASWPAMFCACEADQSKVTDTWRRDEEAFKPGTGMYVLWGCCQHPSRCFTVDIFLCQFGRHHPTLILLLYFTAYIRLACCPNILVMVSSTVIKCTDL